MKSSSSILFLTTLLALASCKSSGADKAASTVKSLESLQMELVKGRDAITASVTTLNLLAEEGGDMSAEYKTFCKAVDGVDSQCKRVRSIHESLAERRKAFVASWEENTAKIQNANLKEKALERRDAVVAKFERLKSSGAETRAEFDQWLNDLKDVRTYLENDLNSSGVASVSKDIKSIDKRSGKINETLNGFDSVLDELIKAIQAAKPEPMPAGQ